MAPAPAANARATHATTATASTKCTRIATNAPASAKQEQQAHQQTRWLVNQKEEWDVPHRYVLERALGSGSYGTVVVARDSARDDLPVAIKRIEGVQATALNAKRALRELSILRRLGADAEGAKSVALYGAFTRPSPKGPYGMVQGVFKSKGVDLYMVTELATGGDLLSLPGMLTHARVREILSDILQALRLLHSMSVWHRDIKSSNVLVSEGRVMVADFGLARSARHAAAEGGELGEELDIADYERSLAQKKGGSGGRASPPPPGPPAGRPHAPGRAADRALGPNRHQHHFTSAVATPCYRAPECVLSEGYYTGAMDVWGAGCIFAELLSRTAEPGAKPLFTLPLGSAMPGSSEEYAFGATKAGRRHAELDAIFGAIGVPPWRQPEAIRSERWRNFLRRTPGRPGDLRQRFAHAGYLAVDLLERMLAFDPKQRPSAEEALSHAFFSDAAPSHDKQSFLPPLPVLMDDSLWGHDMGRPPRPARTCRVERGARTLAAAGLATAVWAGKRRAERRGRHEGRRLRRGHREAHVHHSRSGRVLGHAGRPARGAERREERERAGAHAHRGGVRGGQLRAARLLLRQEAAVVESRQGARARQAAGRALDATAELAGSARQRAPRARALPRRWRLTKGSRRRRHRAPPLDRLVDR